MSQHDAEGIRVRLERVERHQRIILVAWILTIVAFGVLSLIQRASTEPQFVETHGLRIVDRQGRQVLLLGLNDSGDPGIWFYRPGAKEWAMHLGVSGAAPIVTLQAGGSDVDLGFSNNLPALWYHDMSGARRLAMDFVSGNPEIVLYDQTKKIMWRTP